MVTTGRQKGIKRDFIKKQFNEGCDHRSFLSPLPLTHFSITAPLAIALSISPFIHPNPLSTYSRSHPFSSSSFFFFSNSSLITPYLPFLSSSLLDTSANSVYVIWVLVRLCVCVQRVRACHDSCFLK